MHFFLLITGYFISAETMRIHVTEDTKRIIEGNLTEVKDYGFTASIQIRVESRWKHLCGGALVAPKSIISAAHCYDFKIPEKRVRALIGAFAIYDDMEPGRQAIEIVKIINHPNFDRANFTNDIAVLEMQSYVTLNEHIKFISLPEVDNVVAGTSCIALGWGYLSPFGPPSEVLREHKATLISLDECIAHNTTNTNVSSFLTNTTLAVHAGHVCTKPDIAGVCSGDGGGPLACLNGTSTPPQLVLTGIIADTDGQCGIPGSPGVFTRVAYLSNTNFIKENANLLTLDEGKCVSNARSVKSGRNVIGVAQKAEKLKARLTGNIASAMCKQTRDFSVSSVVQGPTKDHKKSGRGVGECFWYSWSVCGDTPCEKFKRHPCT